jgi:putative FmdB family regulatory protein
VPTYEYACTQCDHTFEQVQSFADASLTTCPNCGGELRKVFSAVGVVFKGSGFYRTESRKAESSSTPKTPSKSESKSESKSDSSSAPAKKEPSSTPSASAAPAAASSASSTKSKPSTSGKTKS